MCWLLINSTHNSVFCSLSFSLIAFTAVDIAFLDSGLSWRVMLILAVLRVEIGNPGVEGWGVVIFVPRIDPTDEIDTPIKVTSIPKNPSLFNAYVQFNRITVVIWYLYLSYISQHFCPECIMSNSIAINFNLHFSWIFNIRPKKWARNHITITPCTGVMRQTVHESITIQWITLQS